MSTRCRRSIIIRVEVRGCICWCFRCIRLQLAQIYRDTTPGVGAFHTPGVATFAESSHDAPGVRAVSSLRPGVLPPSRPPHAGVRLPEAAPHAGVRDPEAGPHAGVLFPAAPPPQAGVLEPDPVQAGVLFEPPAFQAGVRPPSALYAGVRPPAPPKAGVRPPKSPAAGVRPPQDGLGVGLSREKPRPRLPNSSYDRFPCGLELADKPGMQYVLKVNFDFSKDTVLRLLCSSTRAVTSVVSLIIPNNPLYGPCRTITVCPIARSNPPVLITCGGGAIIPGPFLLCIAGFILFKSGPVLILAPFAAMVAKLVVRAANTPRFSLSSRL